MQHNSEIDEAIEHYTHTLDGRPPSRARGRRTDTRR